MSVPVDSVKRVAPSVDSRIGSNGGARSISWSKTVVFSLLPVLVLLLLAEGGLRVYSWYFRTAYERYNASAGRLELVPGLQTKLSDGRNIRINSKGFIGVEFEDKKPQGVYRIFTLGDSCTFGGDWDMSYAAFLGKRLNAASKNFEVINAGIEGYNSEYALGRLKDDILKYSPDLVTIYIGWNDLMKQSPNTMSVTGQITWLGRALSNSYIYKGLSKVMFFHVRSALLKPQVTGEESEYHVFDSFVPATYEENVSAMVAVLHEHNVRVMLMTRPTALTRSMTLDDLRTQNIFFPFFPEAYSVPRLLSLHDAYNNSIRRLAARLQVPLVDLDEEFNRHDKKPLFWDTMHPSKSGHELIEKTLEERIRQVVAPVKLQ
ncbi:MAG: SGNH/GDSL hydrolase family protein [Nitrospira sp.]